jgi:hypothetical protein
MTILSVNSNVMGTTSETESTKATSTGQLTTSVDTTGLSAAEIDEVEAYFEAAITESLAAVLPQGSYITVTGITNGVVDYEITMFNDPGTDFGSLVASIDATLSQPSTQTAIQESVISDSNGIIEGSSISMTGSLSVTGLNINTSAELQEATDYFETAITDSLASVLPDGAVVTVTGFSNGVVEYEITLSADSSTDATNAVSQITSSLAQPSTLSGITTSAQAESSGGSLSLTSLVVNSNTARATTETTVSKVTSTGQLATTVSITGLSAAEIEEVATIFEESIAGELNSQGVLPSGSFVTVTGINNGVITYEITMFNDPSADSSSIVSSIDSALAQTSTLSSIQTSVQTTSSSGSSSVASALSSMTVSSFTAGETTGKSRPH